VHYLVQDGSGLDYWQSLMTGFPNKQSSSLLQQCKLTVPAANTDIGIFFGALFRYRSTCIYNATRRTYLAS